MNDFGEWFVFDVSSFVAEEFLDARRGVDDLHRSGKGQSDEID